ncbi:MAG: putative selenate ABC transporter substrate-binding protein [Cyanobacteria bacterium M_surface_7_m2_037]|nr:putative selenate ABC transporter substrate-binding protein [Cyanobacteria bacterium K_DeepCast_0m_m1_088]MBM5796180.1 putative selenate ABC transporter substrate-binding protein [Cyanobacteria bacterium M_surface_7_m2_037]MBM5818878.1 putative selenate ABC transporter substrate-binding protein [Cyanobacteria bacterium K_DeepCast_150m_m2_101]
MFKFPQRGRERSAAVLAGIGLALAPAALPSLSPALAPLPAVQAQQSSKPVLRISAIPDQQPEKLNRLYGLVANELSKQLGVQVQYVPVTNYAAAVSAFRTGNLDLVWFGGLTGVQARLQKPGAKVLAQRDIDASFHTIFIANTKSGLKPVTTVQGLSQLKGKRFTFGSESSTSGRLMPQYFLGQAGVKPNQFAGGSPGFSGSHDATIALVQSGAYEAGAVNEQVWRSNLHNGKASRSKVMAIWKTPGYPDYHWIAQPDLDKRFGKGFTNRIQQAILSWRPSNPEQKQILSLFGAQQFTTAKASAYSRIEQVGRQIGQIR